MHKLAEDICQWTRELGFQAIGITEAQIPQEGIQHLDAWLAKGYHADMEYMTRHKALRTHPAQLHEGTLRVISARVDYLPTDTGTVKIPGEPEKAYVSRYALGRDYHKLTSEAEKPETEKGIELTMK